MAGPFSEAALEARHGRHFNVIPSFGLRQGVKEDGAPKYRRIDDHSAGQTNAAATRMQKIPMAMVDYVVVMIRGFYEQGHRDVVLATEDMQGAYRQIPLPDSQVCVSVTAVYNPGTKQADLFEIFGQPFGAGHAVPNFCRVAEFLARLCTRAYHAVLDHFFDDFFLVDWADEAAVCMFCIRESFQLLGYKLDPDKSQPPAAVAQILGVVFCTEALATERRLQVRANPRGSPTSSHWWTCPRQESLAPEPGQ